MALEDKRYAEFAIPIKREDLIEIVNFAGNEWRNNIMPPRMDHKEWHAVIYLKAIEQFLLKHGSKLNFKVEV